MSQLFAWGSQSIEVSASASVLPMNKFLVCAKSLFKKHLSHLCWELLKQDSFKSSGESDPIRNAAGRACGFALNVRSRQGIPESEVRPRSTVDRDWPKAPSVGRDPGERAKKRRTDSLGNCHCPYFKIHFVDSMSSITSTAKLPQEIKSPTKGCFQPQHLWHLGLDCCCGGCPTHCRVFSSIPGLCLEAGTTTLHLWQPEMLTDLTQCPLGRKTIHTWTPLVLNINLVRNIFRPFKRPRCLICSYKPEGLFCSMRSPIKFKGDCVVGSRF